MYGYHVFMGLFSCNKINCLIDHLILVKIYALWIFQMSVLMPTWIKGFFMPLTLKIKQDMFLNPNPSYYLSPRYCKLSWNNIIMFYHCWWYCWLCYQGNPVNSLVPTRSWLTHELCKGELPSCSLLNLASLKLDDLFCYL